MSVSEVIIGICIDGDVNMAMNYIMAGVCSDCASFAESKYNCPYIDALLKMSRHIESICNNHSELESVCVGIGCKKFVSSHEKPTI